MRGLNKVILIGNLGKDPEYKEDLKRTSFSLATTESYNDKDGQRVDQTEWHNIVVWGNLAEIAAKYLKKGTPLYVEGKIRSRSYEADGQKKYITEIRADNFIMLGGKRDDDSSSTTSSEQSYSAPEMPSAPQPDDDLPF
jgi:single-strand DNA-binding protein